MWKTAAYFFLYDMLKKLFKETDASCKKKKLKVLLTKRLRESARNRLVPVESASACLTPASYTAPFYLQEVC